MTNPAEDPPEISVVVPLYNEVENIPFLQQELRSALTGLNYELVLVDDGSNDGSADKIERDGRVQVVRLERNSGQSAAMYVGMHHARGKIVALIDGDLQNDPADIPKLAGAVREGTTDLACGYRAKRKDTTVKRITSRVANFVRSRFTGDGVRDTGCTLKAMRRECVQALVPFHGMHRFIPALVKGAGYRLMEFPVNHRARKHGVSKYGLANRALWATMDMFGVRWLLSRQLKYRVKAG